MRIYYLHGFASSTTSTKASFFAAKLHEHGIKLFAPDLNEPDFSTLTITRMVEQITSTIDALPLAQPVVLIGSSLGAFVAVHVALKRTERVVKLVLLAPALDFGGKRATPLGDRSLDEWKAAGSTNVFHYGYRRMMPIWYQFYLNACEYDCADVELPMPIQIFQGRKDTVVDAAAVEQWANARPNVELHMVDDDHQLAGSLEYIWGEVERFLRL
jgi:pimeloyl-ACP methyl ester carboxylesterase